MQPLVSICVITYNQDKYIAQALDGILNQKTNFEIEVVVGEDCSKDNTREVLRIYKEKYPEKIELIFNNKNIGMLQNFFQTLLKAKGKYIALCEGDDYWIDEYKLKKQVEFMEANLDFEMICTDYHKYYQSTNRYKENCFKLTKYKDFVLFDDYVVDRSTIGTATAMTRATTLKNYFNDIPANIRNSWNVGDTPLWLYIAKKSKIKVLPDVTAVYRILDNSACHYETPKEKYEFRKKGFEIPFYFIEKYGAQDKTKNLLTAKFLRNELFYHSEILEHTESRKIFNEIKSLRALKVADYIFLFASLSKVTNGFAKVLLAFISKIKNG